MLYTRTSQVLNPSGHPEKIKRTLFTYSLAFVIADGFIAFNIVQNPVVLIVGIVLWTTSLCLLCLNLAKHPFAKLGIANHITLCRMIGTLLLASLIPIAHHFYLYAETVQTTSAWVISTGVVLLLILDGLDGLFARKQKLASEFGARFDMEVDAFLTLVLSILLWLSGTLAIWVLGLGLLRYLFVFSAYWIKPLKAPLFPSFRRKLICVVQLGALCLVLSPLLSSQLDQLVAFIALILLSASFTVDVRWLLFKAQ